MVAVPNKISFEELVSNSADASAWKLTRLEKAALARLIENVVETVVEVGQYNGWWAIQSDSLNEGDWADLTLKLTQSLLTEGLVLPRLLAAAMTESFLCGDRKFGKADPPEDGILGQAIAEYMEKVSPVVRLRLHGDWPGIFFPTEAVSEAV